MNNNSAYQKKVLDDIARTMVNIVFSVDKSREQMEPKWPSPLISSPTIPLVYNAPYFWKSFYSLVKKLEGKNYTHKDIAQLFVYPSVISRIIHVVYGKRLTGLSKKQEIEVILLIHELISFLTNNPLCKKGEHKLLDKKQVKDIISNLKFTKLSKNENLKKAIVSIEGKLFSYTEFIYMLYHNMGHEFHGPYKINSQESLFVKEFHDLRPEFWPLSKALGFDGLKIYYIYKHQDIDISIDWQNRIFMSAPLINKVSKYCIQVSNKTKNNIQDLQAINKNIDKCFTKLINSAIKMDSQQALEKMAEINFYILKPLADELKVDWHPPQGLYKQIRLGKCPKKLQDRLKLIKTTKRDKKGILKFYDVRINP